MEKNNPLAPAPRNLDKYDANSSKTLRIFYQSLLSPEFPQEREFRDHIFEEWLSSPYICPKLFPEEVEELKKFQEEGYLYLETVSIMGEPCGWAVYSTHTLDKFSHFKGCKQAYKGIRKEVWSIENLLEEASLLREEK